MGDRNAIRVEVFLDVVEVSRFGEDVGDDEVVEESEREGRVVNFLNLTSFGTLK